MCFLAVSRQVSGSHAVLMNRAQPLFRSVAARKARDTFRQEMEHLRHKALSARKEGGDLASVTKQIDALRDGFRARKREISSSEDAVLAAELLQSGHTELEYMLGELASGVRHEVYIVRLRSDTEQQ